MIALDYTPNCTRVLFPLALAQMGSDVKWASLLVTLLAVAMLLKIPADEVFTAVAGSLGSGQVYFTISTGYYHCLAKGVGPIN